MTIDEIRERLLELAKTNRVTDDDSDLLERTEVELDAAFQELERCRDRIKRLVEAGDAMMLEPYEYTFEQWIQAKEAKP